MNENASSTIQPCRYIRPLCLPLADGQTRQSLVPLAEGLNGLAMLEDV
jgi:hypothetical protein